MKNKSVCENDILINFNFLKYNNSMWSSLALYLSYHHFPSFCLALLNLKKKWKHECSYKHTYECIYFYFKLSPIWSIVHLLHSLFSSQLSLQPCSPIHSSCINGSFCLQSSKFPAAASQVTTQRLLLITNVWLIAQAYY